jgi:hypothetical protein
MLGDLFEKYVSCFFCRLLCNFGRLLSLSLPVALVISRNDIHQRSTRGKQVSCMLGSSCSNSHSFSLVFCSLESLDTQNKPGACLEVLVVVLKDSGKSAFVEGLDCPICLTELISLFEVLRNLLSDLA